MKRIIASSLALSLLLGVGTTAIVTTAPLTAEASTNYSYSVEQQTALVYLNSIRQASGLNPVKLNPYLSKAAENHSKYQVTNNVVSHTEEKGKTGFTGVRVPDRVKSVGGSGDIAEYVSEVVGKTEPNMSSSIARLMTTAYHRKGLLDSTITEFGIGRDGRVVTANMATTSNDGFREVAYPYNGQTNVGVHFDGVETPNPLTQFGLKTSGFIIMYAPEKQRQDNLKVTLTDGKGNKTPFFMENGDAIYLFPKQDLKYNETYTVSIDYDGWDMRENKTWSFTTMKDPKGAGTVTPTPTPTPTPVTPTPADGKDMSSMSTQI